MFVVMFATCLDHLIEVLTPVCIFDIARVYPVILGLSNVGTISPNEGYHCDQRVKPNRSMVLNLIYIA